MSVTAPQFEGMLATIMRELDEVLGLCWCKSSSTDYHDVYPPCDRVSLGLRVLDSLRRDGYPDH